MLNPPHMRWIGLLTGLLAFGSAGCSMHPLPEDVSRASTFDIVHKVRCEIWEGLRASKPNEPAVRKIIEGTSIGYDFAFRIDETSKTGTGRLEFKRPSFKDEKTGFFLDLSASASKERHNVREFRIIENLKDVGDEDCAKAAKRPNHAYPITGAIGLAEVTRTYIRLETLTDLVRRADAGLPVETKGDVVFSDELIYTTKLMMGVKPTLELVTVAGSFKLSHTSLDGSASRDDVHSVTVALARDAAHEDVDIKTVRAGQQRLEWVGNETILAARETRGLLQKDTLAPNRVLLELQRRRNVREDARVVARVLGVPVAP